jgi:tripartite motif-containing protein 71
LTDILQKLSFFFVFGGKKSIVTTLSIVMVTILLGNQSTLGQQAGNDASNTVSVNHILKYDSDGNFLSSWGTEGTADGQFLHPHGIAVDSSGNVYVVDEERQDVQKFDNNGKFILKWGSPGSGKGQFSTALEDIAVNESDQIYVVDRRNDRVAIFDNNGNSMSEIGSRGTEDGQFKLPWGVAFDSSGKIYVTDRGNNRIQIFNSDGTFLTKWSGSEESFPHLHGIAIDSSNNIYVTDERPLHVVQKFDHNGKLVKEWGGKGDAAGQFEYLHGIALDSKDNIYVVDTQNTRIQKFTPDGEFLKEWGSLGINNGHLMFPQDIAIDSQDNIYVTDHRFAHPTVGYIEDFIRSNNLDIEIEEEEQE